MQAGEVAILLETTLKAMSSLVCVHICRGQIEQSLFHLLQVLRRARCQNTQTNKRGLTCLINPDLMYIKVSQNEDISAFSGKLWILMLRFVHKWTAVSKMAGHKEGRTYTEVKTLGLLVYIPSWLFLPYFFLMWLGRICVMYRSSNGSGLGGWDGSVGKSAEEPA